MYKLTIVFGVLFILLGLGFFVGTGSAHYTSLIPSGFGVVLCLFGLLANSEEAKTRMLWMHVAVTVALLAFLGTIPAIWKTFQISKGVVFARPIAIEEQAIMSLLCLLFVAFCVRSFIAARKARLA